ncbi:hypothetical protein ISR94_03120 [Candidatus Microgenomates bacterium]|nr:hypothetical protein [Candidatus Microgenomates bacterium]
MSFAERVATIMVVENGLPKLKVIEVESIDGPEAQKIKKEKPFLFSSFPDADTPSIVVCDDRSRENCSNCSYGTPEYPCSKSLANRS